MANFHITAVFETRGASQEEAERVAAAALPLLRHPRMHYVEHDTSGGLGPYPPGQSLYFSTIAEFDVEAYTEEKAVELAEDILDRFSTDTIHYLGHGIIPGTPRVQPEERKARDEDRRATSEAEEEQDEREHEQGGKGRRSQRGRGRKRGPGRERDRAHEEHVQESLSETPEQVAAEERPAPETEGFPVVAPFPSETVPPVKVTPAPVVAPPVVEVEIEEVIPPPPPPRSSAEMRVTLTVSLRASEIIPSDGQTTPTEDELNSLAVTEARRRHPELPAEASPEFVIASLPAGDRMISLTWHYQSPVPSAAEEG